jgi:hypothetical protein
MLVQRFLTQVFGTFVALLGGWLAGIAFSFVSAALDAAIHPQQVPVAALIAVPWIVALGSLSFIVPVWLFLLIPLYLLVPPSWPLWRWPICTALGVLSGICIVAYFLSQPNVNPPVSIFSWYILASVIGGVTCFVGSITRKRFGWWHTAHLTNR